MNYTPRVCGYQIKDVTYVGLPPKGTPPRFDIVKWNQYDAPKLVHCFEKSSDGSWADLGMQERTEYCFVVGVLEWNAHEPCFEFRSIGTRWLEENPPQEVVEMVLRFAKEKGKELEADEDD